MTDSFNSNFLHLNLPSSTGFGVSVAPLVLFSILDHHLRKDDAQPRVIGALLGFRSEDGSEVEVRNCFPLSHNEAEDQQVAIDTEYLAQMYSLHQRINTREVIVGWYSSGVEINENSVWIHEFFANETAPLAPVHLVMDTTLSNDKLGVRSYISSPIGISGGPDQTPGSMFTQIPCEVKYCDVERSGLDVISLAKSNPDSASSLLSDMDNLERSIYQIQDMIETVANYVDRVLDRSEVENNVIGRHLMDIITAVPRIDAGEFEKTFNSHLQDLLMVVYLAGLTRTQLAIAERLQNLV
ncbi:JAB1/Mov34/MPN/PAD-1 ubiquitin protease-domain-containing protein [Polychytrium aggregatum]|uniref:JAB1/Mov34/MPN/PAD-1 ubiquitin protease-domain-containing protein n=1 Tax=Polychytrium aggregatum TaxID=110093 RepID=UPI0022FE8660|nr:JAB1/Mov34/MPN/PAD-1 ubiquitin protease-domain-containing protein [Polychytrium aggregatum]KAI9208563.1 JAB1/Mov34/MPN/PAD-1 ubiquitin protease-domain-containing protein [Polychytrium aggregatum]